MRLHIYLFIAISFCLLSARRSDGQSWFRDGAPYVKVKISQDGVYSLRADVLGRLQPALGAVASGRLQVWQLGKELPLLVADGGDNLFSGSDSIVFFARKNRGELEGGLYQSERYRASYHNPEHAIYGDTSAVFITAYSDARGKRLSYADSTLTGARTRRDYLNAIITITPRVEYNLGQGALRYAKVHQSFVNAGEGWGTLISFTYDEAKVAFPHRLMPGYSSKGVVWMYGRSVNPHKAEIAFNGSVVDTKLYANFERLVDSINFATPAIQDTFRVKVVHNPNNDYQSLGFVRTYLPCQPRVQAGRPGSLFRLPDTSRGSYQFSLGTDLSLGYLLDVSSYPDVKLMRAGRQGFNYSLDSAGYRFLFAQSEPVTPRRVDLSASTHIAPAGLSGGEYLIITTKALADSVVPYGAYRASQAGGAHRVRIIFVEDLVHNIHFGVKSNSIIKDFFDGVGDNQLPKAVFLVGRGIQADNLNTPEAYLQDQLPVYGVPGSDYWAVANLRGPFLPRVPFGRLSVQDMVTAGNYFKKVRDYETDTIAEYRKNLYHLSGGRTLGEIYQFRGYIANYGRQAASPFVGASTRLYSKQTDNIIEAVNIRESLNKGLGYINLFGHSAATTTDIDIGNAQDPNQNFDNGGKYPVILINGCYAGNVFDDKVFSLNENWTFAKDKGAIAFLGNMDEGLPPLLNKFTDLYYRFQFQDSTYHHAALGALVKRVSEDYITTYSNVFDSIMLSQVILHGDPALRVYPRREADYTFDSSQVSIRSKSLFGPDQSIVFNVGIRNLGVYRLTDTLEIVAKVTYPDGRTYVAQPLIFGPLGKDTIITYTLEGGLALFGGQNRVELILNYRNQVVESNYNNNRYAYSLYVPVAGIKVLSPVPDAIVEATVIKVAFQASISSPTSRAYIRLYRGTGAQKVYLNTTPVRLSSLCQVDLSLPTNAADSSVYLWELRDGPRVQDSLLYQAAFTYIANITGWSQSTAYQYNKADREGVYVDSSGLDEGMWRMTTQRARVLIKNVGGNRLITPENTGIWINDVPFYYGTQSNCNVGDAILVLRLKQNTLKPLVSRYQPPLDEYWRYSCGRVPTAINFYSKDVCYSSDAGGYNVAVYNIAEASPGDYLFAMSNGKLNYKLINPGFYQASAFVGANDTVLRKLKKNTPFILAGVRTFGPVPASRPTIVADTNNAVPDTLEGLTYQQDIETTAQSSTYTSPFIGPASRWERIALVADTFPLTDTLQGYLVGFANRRSLRGDTLVRFTKSGRYGIDSINAKRYPFVKLSFRVNNPNYVNEYRIKALRVYFESVPEGVAKAIDRQSGDAFPGDSVVLTSRYLNVIGRVGTDSGVSVLDVVRSIGGDTIYSKFTNERFVGDSITHRAAFVIQPGQRDSIFCSTFYNPELDPEQFYENNQVIAAFPVSQDTLDFLLLSRLNGQLVQEGQLSPRSLELGLQVRRFASNSKANVDLAQIFLAPLCDTCDFILMEDVVADGSPTSLTSLYTKRLDLAPGTYKFYGSIIRADGRIRKTGVSTFKVVAADSLFDLRIVPNPAFQKADFIFGAASQTIGADVELEIVNGYGQIIYTAQQKIAQAGYTRLPWSGQMLSGTPASSGIYQVRLKLLEQGQAKAKLERRFVLIN